jgi:hypothetical protein
MIPAGRAVLGRFYDRCLGEMTIPAPEPDPSAHQSASEPVDDGGRVGAGCGELRVLAAAAGEDPAAAARVVRSLGELGGARAAARRLRAAPPVQLELVSGRRGPGGEVVWASLPERSRAQVLVLLARLIDSGAVEEEKA